MGAHLPRPTLRPSGKQLWKAGADSPASAQRGSRLQGRPACAAEALLVLKRRLSGRCLMSHTLEPEPRRRRLCPSSKAGISQEGLCTHQALVRPKFLGFSLVLSFTSGAWFDIGAGFYARSPSCIFRAPLLCQVPSFRYNVSFYVRCPQVYIKYPSLLSGSRFTSDTRLLRQTPRFTSGTRFYVRSPGLHQAPSFTSDAQVCQTPSFYVRHPVLHQAPRLTSGARFLRQTPGSSQAPRFTSGTQFLRHTAGFCISRPHQVLGFYTRGHVGCPGLRQEPSVLMCLVFTSGAQVYVRVQVLH